jgi:hypothetical protein
MAVETLLQKDPFPLALKEAIQLVSPPSHDRLAEVFE